MLSRKKGSETTQGMHVFGGATTEATMTGLEAATTYFIKVAAVNNAGVGVYSTEIMVIREGIVDRVSFVMLPLVTFCCNVLFLEVQYFQAGNQ